jgi:hypothetical protein
VGPDDPAYAGFTFTFIGAFLSHLASGQHREAAVR